jgi:hypothetical protein
MKVVLNQLNWAMGQASRLWGSSEEEVSEADFALLESLLSEVFHPLKMDPETKERIRKELIARAMMPAVPPAAEQSGVPWQTAAMVGSAVSILGLAYWLYTKSSKKEVEN